MAFGFVVLGAVAVLIVTLFLCGEMGSPAPCVIGLPITAALVAWFLMAVNMETEYDTTIICRVRTIDKVDIITYSDEGRQYIVNLNDKFSRDFDESDVIKVQIAMEGPYRGLYFHQIPHKFSY